MWLPRVLRPPGVLRLLRGPGAPRDPRAARDRRAREPEAGGQQGAHPARLPAAAVGWEGDLAEVHLQPGAQPVDVGQDLPADRPFAGAALGRGARLEDVREQVLLTVRVLERGGELGFERLRVRRQRLHEPAVRADRLAELREHAGEPVAGLLVPDRAGLGRGPGAVQHQPGQAAQRHRGVLERLQPAAQRDLRRRQRTRRAERARVQPGAVFGLPQRVVDVLDLTAQRPGLVEPLADTRLVSAGSGVFTGRDGGQVGGHPVELPGQPVGQLADRVAR